MPEHISDIIKDFFEPEDLVKFLGVSIEEVLCRFEDLVEERLEDILNEIGYDREDSED